MVWTGKLTLPARDQPIAPESMTELLQQAPVCRKHGVEKKRVGEQGQWACHLCVREGSARRRAKLVAKGLTTDGKVPQQSSKNISIPLKQGPRIPRKDAGKFIGPKQKCSSCGKLLRYYWNGYAYYGKCNTCNVSKLTDTQKAQRAIRSRRWLLKQLYGITEKQYNQLLTAQGGKCAVCGATEPGGIGKVGHLGIKRFHIDHCHSTGKVRGLLCGHCNKGIGHFQDDALRLQKAIRYLNGGNADLVGTILHNADEALRDGREPDAGSDADPGVSAKRAET